MKNIDERIDEAWEAVGIGDKDSVLCWLKNNGREGEEFSYGTFSEWFRAEREGC